MKRLTLTLAAAIACVALLNSPGYTEKQKQVGSLDVLQHVSDSVQALLAKSLLDSDAELLASIIPDDLGIVWFEGQTCTGAEATTLYDSLFFERVGGSTLELTRKRIDRVSPTPDYAHELISFRAIVPATDSSVQTYSGHFTSYWQWVDGTWHWRRVFMTYR